MAVLSLLVRAHLAKRRPRFGNQKDRVIAEARVASPFGDDLTPAFALEELGRPVWSSQRDRAGEAGQPRARKILQPIQQRLRTLLLRRADARGPSPWIPSQNVDLDP